MFNETVLTKKGIALNNKVQAGYATIEYLRVGLGKGIYEKNEKLEDQENLKEEKQSVPISSIKIIDEKTVKLRVVINNEGITEGYDITEIGLYATDPDEGEILYSVANATEGKADYQPSKTEVVDYQITIDLYSTVSNSNNVTIKLDTGAAASAADLIQLKEDMSKGDISETVIETLNTVEDKYPIPTAGESVKRFFGKVLTFLRNIRPLTGDINVYVSTTGSDITGDGTQSNPFKTIQRAIDMLPKDLGGYTASIIISGGMYSEDILIPGFGNGTLLFMLSGNVTVNSVTTKGAFVIFNGDSIRTFTMQYLYITNGSIFNAYSNIYITTTGYIQDGGVKYSIFIEKGSTVYISGNTTLTGNTGTAICVTTLSRAYFFAVTGTGFSVGTKIWAMAQLTCYSNAISATTAIQQGYGGMTANSNGTQISTLAPSTLLTCTWGTVSGGYYRDGIPNGAAVVYLGFSVMITTPLTANQNYTVSGIPQCALPVMVASCSDKASTKHCYVTSSGTFIFNPSINIGTGNNLIFGGSYITSA